jgi:hypothetical protein
MALFISVLGLSGLASFAALGLLMELYKSTATEVRTAIFFAKRRAVWQLA